MWRMGILNSYTMESTFSGSTLGSKCNSHFTYEDLKSLGYHVCDTLLDFCDPDRSKFQQCVIELKEILQQKIQKKLLELGCDQNTEGTWSDISLSDVESSTSGSNSSQSDDPPAQLLSMTDKEYNEKKKKKKKKKKHLRTRKERNYLYQKHALSRTLKHQEAVVASPISPSPGKPHSLSKRSWRDSSLEKKNKQMNQEGHSSQGKELEDSVSSLMQGENPDTTQEEHPESPKGNQYIPMAKCDFKIQNPQPLTITTIQPPPAQRPSLINLPIKQQLKEALPEKHGQLKKLPDKQNEGTSVSSFSLPALGVRRYSSMWWTPETSMTLMLRRGVSLKSHIKQDKNQLWNLSQSKSQVLPNQEFRWRPLKIDRLLLGVKNKHHHAKVRGAPKETDQKYSLLDRKAAGPKSEAVPFPESTDSK